MNSHTDNNPFDIILNNVVIGMSCLDTLTFCLVGLMMALDY